MAPAASLYVVSGDSRSDGIGDQVAVKSAIFDENFVGVHAGHNDSGEINSRARAFQRVRVGTRALRVRLQRDSGSIQELQVRPVSYQREDEVVRDRDLAAGRRYLDGIRCDP